MKETCKQLLKFVLEKFPDVYAAFLTGSAVDEYFNEESDYDVYIITNTRDYVFNESFIYSGMNIQAIHLPLAKIDEILWYDTFSRMGIHLTSFKKGKILIDTGRYLANVINESKIIFNDGPPSCPLSELKFHKIGVLNLMSDLKGNKHDEEKIIISHELYKAFIKFYLDYHRQWNSSNKHLARQFKNSNPHLSKLLLDEMQDFHKTLNPKKLLEVIDREILIIGNIDNGYSQFPGLINVKSNYIILRLTGEMNLYKLSATITNKLTHIFSREISSFTFRSRPLGDDETIAECLYLVLQTESEAEINGKILPEIENGTLFKELEGIRMHYPVNFDFDLVLGGAKLLDPMLRNFSLISSQYSSILNNESESIVYSFHFVRIFRKAFFLNDKKKWRDFLNFTNDSWLARAYDNKKIHSLNQLVKAKEMLLETFEKQFASQLIIIKKILNSEEDQDKLILNELKNLKSLIKSQSFVKSHQKHPVDSKKYKVMTEWVIYRNMLDYILGIFMYKESQKPYFIYVLIRLVG